MFDPLGIASRSGGGGKVGGFAPPSFLMNLAAPEPKSTGLTSALFGNKNESSNKNEPAAKSALSDFPPPPGMQPKPAENAWPGFEQKKPTAVQAFDDGGWDDDDWNLDDDFDKKPEPPKRPIVIEAEPEEDFDDFDENASFDDADYM